MHIIIEEKKYPLTLLNTTEGLMVIASGYEYFSSNWSIPNGDPRFSTQLGIMKIQRRDSLISSLKRHLVEWGTPFGYKDAWVVEIEGDKIDMPMRDEYE